MNLEIVSCKVAPNTRQLAEVIIKYGLINIRCGLTIFIKDKNNPKLWLRMPEYWLGKEKIPQVSWIDRGVSDLFQRVALDKIREQYGIDLPEAVRIYKTYCKKRQKSRKS